MLTDFCVLCGEFNPVLMEVHHVIPRVNGGTDNYDNLITVCSPCHSRIHELGIRRGNMRELQAVGIARARTEGKFKGRKPIARMHTDGIVAALVAGTPIPDIAARYGIGIASVYRIRRDALAIGPLRQTAK